LNLLHYQQTFFYFILFLLHSTGIHKQKTHLICHNTQYGEAKGYELEPYRIAYIVFAIHIYCAIETEGKKTAPTFTGFLWPEKFDGAGAAEVTFYFCREPEPYKNNAAPV
jgi:hypothetical protein